MAGTKQSTLVSVLILAFVVFLSPPNPVAARSYSKAKQVQSTHGNGKDKSVDVKDKHNDNDTDKCQKDKDEGKDKDKGKDKNKCTEEGKVPVHLAPAVDAGPNQTITLPSSVTLNGKASELGLPPGSTLTTTWSKVSGLGTVTFANVNALTTTALFSSPGTYVLRINATDGSLQAKADVTITVNPAVYYVDVSTGNDSNSGNSRQPWRTIQRAANAVSEGATVNVRAGTYGERVRITISGTAVFPITFQAQSTAVLKGFSIDASYVRIVGFEIGNVPANGVDPAGSAGVYSSGQSNLIRSNYIHDVGSWGVYLDTTSSFNTVAYNRIFRAGHNGIWLHGTGHLVEGNDISRSLQFPANWTNPPIWSDADGIDIEGSRLTIRKNSIHDILRTDPENSSGPHSDCFQITNGGADIIIEQNICSIPRSPIQLFQAGQLSGPLQNLTIRNNIVHDMGRGFTFEGVMNGVKVLNNTFVNVDGSAVSLSDAMNVVIVKNNIFYNIPLAYIEMSPNSPTTAIGNNLSYGADGPSFPGDVVNADPEFVNVTSGDYHLRPNSPAIDAGVDTPDVTNDFDGISRPRGLRTDIGAYEFH